MFTADKYRGFCRSRARERCAEHAILRVGPEREKAVRNNSIHYSVPSGNFVKLDVVDGRGKQVAVVVDGFKHAGDYETLLPGALGRGVYIIRLTAGTKKIAAMQVKL